MVDEYQVLYDNQNSARQLANNLSENLDVNFMSYGSLNKNGLHKVITTHADFTSEMRKKSSSLNYRAIEKMLVNPNSKFYKIKDHYFLPRANHDNKVMMAGFGINDAVMVIKQSYDGFDVFGFGSSIKNHVSKLITAYPNLFAVAKYDFLDRGKDLIKKLKGQFVQGRKLLTIGDNKMAYHPEKFLKNCNIECYHMALNNGHAVRISNKERLVMLYLSHANTAKEIGRHMEIAESTVNTHIDNIKKKLGVFTKSEMMRFYLRSDLALLGDCNAIFSNE